MITGTIIMGIGLGLGIVALLNNDVRIGVLVAQVSTTVVLAGGFYTLLER